MNTKFFLTSIILYLNCFLIVSQNSIDEVLQSIEVKNETLNALRKTTDAQILENKTGIYLSNPQVEFGYLFGKPDPIGNRKDFSASQDFDIPTILGMKRRLADKQNMSAEMNFKAERMGILLEAKLLCLDLIYKNSLSDILEKRLSNAQHIFDIYKKYLEEGNTNRLDVNKAELNLLNSQSELRRVELERNEIINKLKLLNGGEEIYLNERQFEPILLPPGFEEWYDNAVNINPLLSFARQEVEVSKDFVRMNKALSLPTFSAGFMSERIIGETFKGVIVGISVPLWENKNRVAHAKALVSAAEAQQVDASLKYYLDAKNRYEIASGLNEISQNYKNLLKSSNSAELLQKALDAGEISLLDYLNEITLYYNSVDMALKAELDFQKVAAELFAVEL